MYDLEALKRKINKEGLSATIRDLSSDTLSDDAKIQLESEYILINGFPNLSLISSLV